MALELPLLASPLPHSSGWRGISSRASEAKISKAKVSETKQCGWRKQMSREVEASCAPRGMMAEGSSSIGRRRVLLLLLSTARLFTGDANAATSALGVANESQEEKAGKEDIGDLFGFDGLGKSPEEYVVGKVVALAQAGDGAVVFLGIDGFELPLQLVVGPAEAMAVLTAVQERKSRRPVTHEAWGLSLAAVGWKVDRVVITGNEKDIFYSNVVLSNLSLLLAIPSSSKKSVEMRPSDGIALALRCRAPLFVRKTVAEELLGAREDLGGKVKKVDPLKQPGLQAYGGGLSIFVDNLVAVSVGEFKPESLAYCSWMRRLQSFLDVS